MPNPTTEFRRPLTVVVFVAITVPLMVHTAQLLLQITNITPTWLAYAYAGFFALGFDLAVFMFSLYDLKGAKKTFAVMAGVVGFFFFNLEILFERLPADSWANGRLWASVVLGTMFAIVGAYLVYHSTELINQVFTAAAAEDGGRETKKKRRGSTQLPHYKHTPSAPRVHGGLKPQPNGNSSSEKILLLKGEGKTNTEIGRQLGISDKTVYRRLKKLEA